MSAMPTHQKVEKLIYKITKNERRKVTEIMKEGMRERLKEIMNER